MPAFPALDSDDLTRMVSYLTTGADPAGSGPQRNNATPPSKYVFTGYRYFNDPEGYPAYGMPWGTLSAIDMNTGKYLWTVPFGQYTELAEKGLTDTGSDSHGGSVLTATGVLFTGGSEFDLKFRAYDSATRQDSVDGAVTGSRRRDAGNLCGQGQAVCRDRGQSRPARCRNGAAEQPAAAKAPTGHLCRFRFTVEGNFHAYEEFSEIISIASAG